MAIGIEEKPGIEERHLCASNTSSLLIDQRHHGADITAAAGMAAQELTARLGLALIHLRAEWDRCDKPRKKTAGEIAARSAQLKAAKVKDHNRRAHAEALVGHAAAMRHRASALTGRSVVMGLLGDWAAFQGVDPDLLSPSLFHWLAPACPLCDGHGVVHRTYPPTGDAKQCDHCRGAGTWPRPLGAEVIHAHIARSIGRIKNGVKGKLYG